MRTAARCPSSTVSHSHLLHMGCSTVWQHHYLQNMPCQGPQQHHHDVQRLACCNLSGPSTVQQIQQPIHTCGCAMPGPPLSQTPPPARCLPASCSTPHSPYWLASTQTRTPRLHSHQRWRALCGQLQGPAAAQTTTQAPPGAHPQDPAATRSRAGMDHAKCGDQQTYHDRQSKM